MQPGFARTGGLHATGLFDAGGELVCVREDVGRHNAMDKVIGWALTVGLVPLSHKLLCVSGRLSFELVQKAAVAGAPVLVGVGAPTSLAVQLAEDRNLTLVRLRPPRPHKRLQRRTPAQASLKSLEEPYACSGFALTIRYGMSIATEFERPARVLVVEDDDAISQVLQRSLRMEGYDVRIAGRRDGGAR